MNDEFGKIRVKIAWVCLILVTVINIICCVYANYRSNDYKVQLSEIQEELKINASTAETLSNDDPLNQLKPILNAGKVAPYALQIFTIGILSGLFSSIFLIIPKLFLKSVEKSLMWDDEWETLDKCYKIFIASNIIIIAFEVYGLSTWFDYGSTIANALHI